MTTASPLSGIKVFELGHSVAAPYAAQVLGELGADVIKVESVSGDYARGWGPPFWNDSAPHFVAINRNKRSICVDLNDEKQKKRLEALILAEADVVICNFKPGSADKKGLGPKALLSQKPSLVYCEIGAFGRGGPMSGKPGYDPLMQAFGGLMSVTGESADRPPIRVGVSVVDMGTGLWAALGVVAALMKRKDTGKGGLVETSLYEAMLAMVAIPVASTQLSGRVPKPYGSGASGIVPYQAFNTKGGWIVIAAGNDHLYAKLVAILGMPELADDPRFITNKDRVIHRTELVPIIEDAVAKFERADIQALLDQVGVPNAPVQSIDEVLACPQTQALGILQPGPEGALPTIGLPLRFDGERPDYRSPSPGLGESTDKILNK